MTPHSKLSACALAALALTAVPVHAEDPAAETIVVTAKRVQRVSKGATGLPLEIKETPQSISTVEREDIANFGVTDSNAALELGTGLNVEQYETNRAVFNARGFEIQLTQIDGLGMTNSWGTVANQQDAYVFERIELVRGANGLLTGVGNSSGTINYVRKRPTNEDGGEFLVRLGSHDRRRVALDYNKVLAEDGSWAGRLVVAHEDRDSHLRALHDTRSTVYAVVDGQVGRDGVLTAGFGWSDHDQDSPMWGSLTLRRSDGSQAEFPRSSSTSQDWSYWNTLSRDAFVEYRHDLGDDWEAKLTWSHRRSKEDTRLIYAYSPTGALNPDGTGLTGWLYGSHGEARNTVLDFNVSGRFQAFGREHSLLGGVSRSHQETATDLFAVGNAENFGSLPAFPYGGDVYPEPDWGPRTPNSGGEQTLTRLYAASRLTLTERLKLVLGVNAIRLSREGQSIYGDPAALTEYSDLEKTSPYVGLTYDFSDRVLGYFSYSDIYQNQDQTDFDRRYLDPVKGVNYEVGVKAEWLDRRLLTTLALFTSKQDGLATFAGTRPDDPATEYNEGGTSWYVPKDVRSKGFEFDATGCLSPDSRLTLGLTRLELSGPDGNDIYEWVPRTTVNFLLDTRVAALPKLKLGVGGKWRREVTGYGGTHQGSYLTADAFLAYELGDKATLQLNVDNLTDTKYVGGLAYGAVYGAPREVSLTLSYAL